MISLATALPPHQTRRLGRLPKRQDKRTLQLAKYLPKALPAVPDVVDWSTKLTNLGPMLNDSLGCHDAETEVLTDRGWQKWPEYDGRSLLGTMNQISGMLEFQAPSSLQRYNYDGPMYFADHSHLDFALTPNHRIFHRPYVIPYPYIPFSAGYAPYDFTTIDNLPTRFVIPSTTTGHHGVELKKIRIGEREWDGDDFIALVALCISDGWTSNTERHWNTISFCCFRDDRYEMVSNFARRISAQELPSRKGVWELKDGALSAWFKTNAYTSPTLRAENKKIPQIIKSTSTNQILHFLSFFGDQHISSEGSRQFFSASKFIVDDLQEILLRAGKRSGVYDRPMRKTSLCPIVREGATDYTVTEWAKKPHVGIQRKTKHPQVVTDQYKGEVFCANVPNSTLITRRNNQILISGNCCAIAAPGHAIQTWSSETEAEVIVTDGQVLQAYKDNSGYDGTPATDTGCNMLDVAKYMRTTGIGGKEIETFAILDHANHDHLDFTIDAFGGVYAGLNLPLSCQNQITWALSVGGTDGNPRAGTWGGHAVWILGKDKVRGTIKFVSWGQLMEMTYEFWDVYSDEAYAFLSTSDWAENKLAPSGFDVDTLRSDLIEVTS